MAASCQNVSQTLEDVISWRPVLEPVLRAFEPLLAAQRELAEELANGLYGLSLPELQSDRLSQGVSLLAGARLSGVAEPLRVCADKLLPLFAAMEALTPHMPALQSYFLKPVTEPGSSDDEGSHRDSRELLAEAMVSGDRNAVTKIAADNGLEPLILEFAAGFMVSTVLRAMVAKALPSDGQAPWNQGDIWQQGYCPVCGTLPSVGWLDKPMVDEKNAYLAGGGGKKHLHCGQCGANWSFRRGACPSCGEEGNGVIEMLRESGIAHGERLDWCTKCKAYCPTVDLREREFVPDLDTATIGMMHLDMVAARKKLRPLRPSFWNMF